MLELQHPLLSPAQPGCPGGTVGLHNSCPAFQGWFKFHLRSELNLQLPLQILSLKLLVLTHIGTDLDEVNMFKTLRSDHQPSCESASAVATTPIQSRPPQHCCSPPSGHCKGQKYHQEGHNTVPHSINTTSIVTAMMVLQ